MRNSFKQKLALFLAVVMLFTMSMPVGLIAGAADVNAVPALEGDVTDLIDPATFQALNVAAFANEGVDVLFDGALSTKFCGLVNLPNEPVEITWSMSEATVVQSYALTSGADSANYSSRDPRAWSLYASHDNAAWVELDSRAEQGFAQNGLTKVYAFENDWAYAYYKLVITENNNDVILQLSAIQLSSANLAEQDADVLAAQAAAEFDEKLLDFGALSHEEQMEQMAALRAEYNALDASARAKVQHLSILEAVEAYVAKMETVPLLDALVAEIDAAMEAGIDPLTGLYDYHLNGKITEALALTKDLGEAADYIDVEKLEAYRTMLNEALPFATTVGTISTVGATQTPWVEGMSVEDVEDTKNAVVDELLWQYARAGYLLGTGYLNGEINLDAGWHALVMSQQEAADGITSPWKYDQISRFWSAIMVPFAGTAFSATGYMAATDTGFPVLSDNFIYNGRVYQQRWDCIMSYPYGYEAPYIYGDPTLAVDPTLQQDIGFPGYDGSVDATNNTFRLAYALYNTEHKLEGEVLGIPTGKTVVGEDVIYQGFASADGIAYIAGDAQVIASVSANDPQERAFVISGDILTAMMGADDFATAIAKTGAPISAVDEDGIQLFENGYATAEGFEAYDDANEYVKVIKLIDNLPTEITRENMAAVESAIEEARAAYDALTANRDAVNNYNKLEELEAAYYTYSTNIAVADAVMELIDQLPAPTEITLEDGEAIASVRDAYDALTDEQKILIENYSVLTSVEKTYALLVDQAAVKAVSDMIDTLPADELIDGDEFEENAEQVLSAEAAYMSLTIKQQNSITDDQYFALMQKLEIVQAGGYTNWLYSTEDYVLAAAVIDRIEALNVVTLDDKAAVEEARAAYESLTDFQKSLVNNLDVLVVAEEQIVELEKIAAENAQKAVDAVIELIDNLPALGKITYEDGEAIKAARAAYDALTDEQKRLIENYSVLEDIEQVYALIADNEAVKAVSETIDALPADELIDGDAFEENAALVLRAQEQFDQLTIKQKNSMTDVRYHALMQKLDIVEAGGYTAWLMGTEDYALAVAVDEKIAALGEVTLEDKAAVEEARAAYDNLTDFQKSLVAGLETLVAAEETIVELEEAAAKAEADAKAAADADALIAALGEVTLEDKAAVEAARAAYDNLTDDQKTLVAGLETLVAAEEKILELEEAAAKAEADAKAAADVDALIAALGSIDSLEQKADVEAARAAYDALTDDQKKLVTKLETLNADEILIKALELVATVEALIEKLTEITSTEQKSDVEAARVAYESLTDDQKKLVTKLDTLVAAEEAIEALENPAVAGDLDGSSVVDVADIMKLKDLIMKENWNDDQLKIGDLSGNSTLDVADIMGIKNIIMGA